MTAPGGEFGESAHSDEPNPPPPEGQTPQEPTQQAPWEPPGSDYPPPAYQPPGYSAGPPADYPAPYPPPMPPGYQQPPVPPYPPPPGYGPPPPGYGPPAYPGGYYPRPDYPMPDYPRPDYPMPDYQGGYGPSGPTQLGTSGLAIASLVSSITGLLCCFIGSIVGIVLGVVALGQIKQTRQGGYGMAVAGIVIGIGTLLVGLVVAISRIHTR
jgi:hypothetical protein